MGRTQKALDERFERLKNKALQTAEEILCDRTQSQSIRLSASREIRNWLALGSGSWQKTKSIPLSPEEAREFLDAFEKFDRLDDLNSDD